MKSKPTSPRKPVAVKLGRQKSPQVAVIMGSTSDLPVMQNAAVALEELGLRFEVEIVSAHRTPRYMFEYAEEAKSRGIQVIIAGAGGAAHLPGMVASLTPLPVIGVPITVGKLKGLDALLSIAQMPKGVPVACVAVDNAYNAGLLAGRILGRTPIKKKAARAPHKK
jgi:phosphoribosylaminoimidazole carboxylase PurE protein